MAAPNQVLIPIHLHPRQGEALETRATEVLYGGAAGGGKSFLMRAMAVLSCAQIPGLQTYLFRRVRDDLIKNHIEGSKGLRSMLAPWVAAKFVDIVEDEIRFWNGSKIYLCHCKDEKDRFKYQGAEIHLLLIDELTHFTEVIYRFLRSRVRMVGINLPAAMEGRFPRILCGSNPGGVGHGWVKAAFVDNVEPMAVRETSDEEGGMLRQYIPARLDDNPSMASDDPTYRARLRGLGSPELVKAMEDGDWNVVSGAFFPEFSTDQHVVTPRTLPSYWHRFRSFDWGSARPFSVGWWAVSDGELPEFPRGALIRYREWYGASAPNVGLRMTAEEVADGIRERERGDLAAGKQMTGVADPAIFAQDGGPSIADRMASRGVFFRPADNTRVGQRGAVGGWDQVRARLKGDGERPALFIFSTCTDLIRTLPALQHDDGRPEDVDTDGEDHAADECFVAGTMIAAEHGSIPIERIKVGEMVRTRVGLREVRAVFSSGIKPVYSVRLSSGQTLTGTGNHPVWVENHGFIPLSELRYGDIMRPCALLSSVTQSKSLLVVATIVADRISAGVGSFCTALYGAISMAASRGMEKFITLITTPATTSQTISFASLGLNIDPTMGVYALESPAGSLSMPVPPLLNGTNLRLAGNGMPSITPRTSRPFSTARWKRLATSAAGRIKRRLLPNPKADFAQMRANPLTVGPKDWMMSNALARDAAPRSLSIAISWVDFVRFLAHLQGRMSVSLVTAFAYIVGGSSRPKPSEQSGVPFVVGRPMIVGRQKVFNLSVDEAEEYFANGILVHNCRYACLSRPYTAPLPPAATDSEPDRYARSYRRKGRTGTAMAA